MTTAIFYDATTEGFYIKEPSKTIAFTGFVANTKNVANCMIYIQASNVWFDRTNITSCDIIIISALTIKIDTSFLSVDGTKQGGLGYSLDQSIGNSYAGSGGYCGADPAPDFTYGDFDTLYTEEGNITFGSGGTYSPGLS